MTDFLNHLFAVNSVAEFLEIIGVVTAIVYVILAAKGNKWCFLFGFISSVIYVYLSYTLKFYFDFGINVYYVFMSFYGWYMWSNERKEKVITIQQLSIKKLLIVCSLGLIITVSLASLATRFSDADLPYLDAFTTVFSIIATYYVVKKHIENWLIWVVVDLVACYMYYYKELHLTSCLFFVYTVIALFGYFKWKKLLAKQLKLP